MEEKARIKKILIVALDNLGDVVMATSILKPLRKLCPQAQIGLWAKTYTAGLFSDQSMIDRLHASDPFWDKSPGTAKGSFWRFIGVCADVRKEKYQVAFILNTEWRRVLACQLAGIPARIGYRRRKSGFFLTESFPISKTVQHFVDDHRQLIEAWSRVGVNGGECLPRLELTVDETAWWASSSIKSHLSGQKFVAIHLFSGDEDKNWPLSCWVELIQSVGRTHPDLKFVVVCGPGEEMKLTPFRSHLAKENVVEIVAPPLGHLKVLLSHALLVLGGDSGLGHVAAALGTPVLSLFGESNPVRSRPLGRSGVSVLQQLPLRNLQVLEVLSKVEELLEHVGCRL